MEFISAKDLPISEAEEVDVLCVENGEMKRKPASGIGGNTKYDLKFKLTPGINEEGNNYTTIELLEGSYDPAKHKLDNFEPISVLAISDWPENEEYGWTKMRTISTIPEATVVYYNELGEVIEFFHSYENLWFILLPDDTCTADY